jgi:hypothetical protein
MVLLGLLRWPRFSPNARYVAEENMQARKINLCIISSLLAFGAVSLRADTSYFTYAATAVNDTGNGQFLPNALYATGSYSPMPGLSGSAFADLSTGQLGIKYSGNVAPDYGTINTFSEAFMGDTITASGSTAGLSLGVDLSLGGPNTASFSDASQNLTFIGVYVLTPGSFDTSDFTVPSQELYNEGFVLGPGTYSYASYFSQFGLNYGGSYPTSATSIPLSIPFSTLGSTFQVLISLETYENGDASTGNTWTVDYSDPVSFSLVAPDGVTLTSASGVLPGTAPAVPEPKSVFLIGGMLMLAVLVRASKLAAVR